jgi:hypothetical protein
MYNYRNNGDFTGCCQWDARAFVRPGTRSVCHVQRLFDTHYVNAVLLMALRVAKLGGKKRDAEALVQRAVFDFLISSCSAKCVVKIEQLIRIFPPPQWLARLPSRKQDKYGKYCPLAMFFHRSTRTF